MGVKRRGVNTYLVTGEVQNLLLFERFFRCFKLSLTEITPKNDNWRDGLFSTTMGLFLGSRDCLSVSSEVAKNGTARAVERSFPLAPLSASLWSAERLLCEKGVSSGGCGTSSTPQNSVKNHQRRWRVRARQKTADGTAGQASLHGPSVPRSSSAALAQKFLRGGRRAWLNPANICRAIGPRESDGHPQPLAIDDFPEHDYAGRDASNRQSPDFHKVFSRGECLVRTYYDQRQIIEDFCIFTGRWRDNVSCILHKYRRNARGPCFEGFVSFGLGADATSFFHFNDGRRYEKKTMPNIMGVPEGITGDQEPDLDEADSFLTVRFQQLEPPASKQLIGDEKSPGKQGAVTAGSSLGSLPAISVSAEKSDARASGIGGVSSHHPGKESKAGAESSGPLLGTSPASVGSSSLGGAATGDAATGGAGDYSTPATVGDKTAPIWPRRLRVAAMCAVSPTTCAILVGESLEGTLGRMFKDKVADAGLAEREAKRLTPRLYIQWWGVPPADELVHPVVRREPLEISAAEAHSRPRGIRMVDIEVEELEAFQHWGDASSAVHSNLAAVQHQVRKGKTGYANKPTIMVRVRIDCVAAE